MSVGYELRGVSAAYGRTRVLHGIDLTLTAGKVIALLGENGSGKSTLLKVLAGIVCPASGEVLFAQRSFSEISRSEAARRIGYLPQAFEPFFPATVHEVVRLGRLPRLRPFHGFTSADARAVTCALRETDALDLQYRQVQQLSGGERQRVYLARVLAGEPEVLLLDEPTASLDPRHRLAVAQIMARQARNGALVVFPTHELDVVMDVADEAVLIRSGSVLAAGQVERVLTGSNLEALFGVTAKVYSDETGNHHISLSLGGGPAYRSKPESAADKAP